MANFTTGKDFYNQAATMIHNFQMDRTMFYTFLNSARTIREMARPWMKLRKLDNSQLASASDIFNPLNPTNSKNMPSDFMMLTKEATIMLFDGQQTWLTYNEIPMDLQIQYKDMSNRFFFDHAAGKLYLLGIVDRQYYIFVFYQADYGDISDTTTWVNIPDRFRALLVHDVIAMYELGVDYDNTNARNANKHSQQAEMIFNAMCTWDDNLQRSSVTTLDYPVLGDTPTFTNRKINMNDD